MKKKILPVALLFLIIIIIFLYLFPGFNLQNTPPVEDGYRIITDMDDQLITVPDNPQRIACMHGVSAERIVTLGQGHRLILAMEPSAWMKKLFPEAKHEVMKGGQFTGNVERMLQLNVDLAIYSPFPGEAEKYRAAGIKTACGFSPQKRPRNIEEYGANFKRQFMFFGELLGPDAKKRAANYCEYFDKKIAQIMEITSQVKKEDRPRVYYGGRGGNPASSQGTASVMHWNTEVAGGNFLPQSIDNNFVEVNTEQIFAWDPDIILLSGYCDSLDIVKQNSGWASLRAVKNGNLYHIPQGVFVWDNASGESILMIIYMAKIFYPELFKDWDMIEEMKIFYKEIYGVNITENDVERILKHLPPVKM